MYATYNVAPQNRAIYITAGDSRSAAQNATNGVGYTTEIEPLLLKPGRTFMNDSGTAHTGYRCDQDLANFFNGQGPAQALALPHDADAWVLLWCGINDSSTLTASQIYTQHDRLH